MLFFFFFLIAASFFKIGFLRGRNRVLYNWTPVPGKMPRKLLNTLTCLVIEVLFGNWSSRVKCPKANTVPITVLPPGLHRSSQLQVSVIFLSDECGDLPADHRDPTFVPLQCIFNMTARIILLKYKIDNVTQNLPTSIRKTLQWPTRFYLICTCSPLLSVLTSCHGAHHSSHTALPLVLKHTGSHRRAFVFPGPCAQNHAPQYILVAHSLTSFKSLHKHHPPWTPQFKCLALFFSIAFFTFCMIQYNVYMIYIASFLHLSYLLPISSTQNGSSKKTWHTVGTQ